MTSCDGISCWIICHRRKGWVLAIGSTQTRAIAAFNLAWRDPGRAPWRAHELRMGTDYFKMHKAVASIPDYQP